jgi:hypothetical protein
MLPSIKHWHVVFTFKNVFEAAVHDSVPGRSVKLLYVKQAACFGVGNCSVKIIVNTVVLRSDIASLEVQYQTNRTGMLVTVAKENTAPYARIPLGQTVTVL